MFYLNEFVHLYYLVRMPISFWIKKRILQNIQDAEELLCRTDSFELDLHIFTLKHYIVVLFIMTC